jgi:ligand-binding sensor domain-containing protein
MAGQTQDVLGARDRNVRVPAVAVDSAGGCWFAAEDGTVGRALLDGRENYTHLPPKSTGEPLRIVPDGEDAAWILTSRGTWRVRLPL